MSSTRFSKYKKKVNAFRDEFIKDLQQQRSDYLHRTLQECREEIGPPWYQVLSTQQLKILRRLQNLMKEDLMEERPWRTRAALEDFGIYPIPGEGEILGCIVFSKLDVLVFLAQFYKLRYDMDITAKVDRYPLIARFLISSIYNISLRGMIELLEQKFYVEKVVEPPEKPKKIEKTKKQVSPYLERMIIRCPEVPKDPKGFKPQALPPHKKLMSLEEEPPSPPAPSKKKPRMKLKPKKDGLSTRMCDQLAGLYVPPDNSVTTTFQMGDRKSLKKLKGRRASSLSVSMSTTSSSILHKRQRKKSMFSKNEKAAPLQVPQFGMSMYNVGGVVRSNGQLIYMINSVTTARSNYVTVHGGIVMLDEVPGMINNGFFPTMQVVAQSKCDCLKWLDRVIQHVEATRCKCRHYYDFGDLSDVPRPIYPYFHPPTTDRSYWFDNDTIMEMDQKSLHVRKTFEKFNDTDSILGGRQVTRERVLKAVQSGCLSENPTPQEYLKCVMRTMRRLHIIATLPESHRAPELVEWMRNRMNGPRDKKEQGRQMVSSRRKWICLYNCEMRLDWNHIKVPKLPFPKSLRSDWSNKMKVRAEYDKVMAKHRRLIYERYAEILNTYWTTMCQFEKPSDMFRDVFFTYMTPRLRDVYYQEPYNAVRNAMRIPPRTMRLNCSPEYIPSIR